MLSHGSDSADCCCRCAGNVIKLLLIHEIKYTQSSVCLTKAVEKALTNWRSEREASWNENYIFGDPELLLPSPAIKTISRAAGSIDNLASLEGLIGMRWAGFETFGSEVLHILLSARRAIQEENRMPVQTRRPLPKP